MVRFGGKLAAFALVLALACPAHAQSDSTSGRTERPSAQSPATGSTSAERFVDLGNAAYDAGRYQQALNFYDQAHRLDPADTTTSILRGLTYVKLDRCEEAIADLNVAADALVFSDFLADLDIYTSRAYCYLELENYEPAAADLESHLQHYPDDDWAWSALGRAYGYLRRIDEAETALKKAITLKPEDSYAYYQLALIYLVEGRPGEAIPYLNDTLRLEPDNEEAADLLASAQAELAPKPLVAAAPASPSPDQLLATCRSYEVPAADAAGACYVLAGHRASGVGIERSRGAAHWLYSRACDFGMAKACLITGVNYELGRSGDNGDAPPSHGGAVEYYGIACKMDATLCSDEAVRQATAQVRANDPD